MHPTSLSSMTRRERHLTILRGGVPDRIPWNCYGWIVPQTAAARELVRKGLGLMSTRRIYTEIHEDVTMSTDRYMDGGVPHEHVTIETPVGTLTEDATIESGYGSRWVKKYFITGEQDYPAVEYFFRHTRFEPDYEPWRRAEAEVGDDGFTVGEIMPIPLMTLMVNWMGIEGLTNGIYFHTAGFEGLMDALDRHYDRQVQLAAESPAEIIWFGDNVTGTIVSPKWFEKYVAPEYRRVMPVMRAAGKIPIAHYDGANRRLAPYLARTDLPVIEAFTPPPVGDITVAEAKAAWPDKVVCINFPAPLFLESFENIYRYTLNLLADGAPGGRFVLGCTEDFPMETFEKTFTAMGHALAEYQGYTWEEF
jgi:hypothetical protein